ncbi:GDSL-type esterase/lipase family protein [Actinophytocola sediminis]
MLAAGSLLVSTPAAVGADDEYVIAKPTAVVSLGDNGISGEGAGDYVAGTKGENGNFCHRSANALVHHTDLAEKTINIACSGARAEHVAFNGPVHYTEGSQAKRLGEIALDYQVTTVIVRVGSNDDPQFSGTVAACISAYLNPDKPECATALRSVWPSRMAAMAPKVRAALTDVKTAMSNAGYSSGSYNLVLTSYASPITQYMVPSDQIGGCPFRLRDAAWAKREALPQLNAALRQVAYDSGANYLDLGEATNEREACAGYDDPSIEWQTRIKVDPYKLVSGQLTPEEKILAAESFHINADGHKQLGNCMTEFVEASAYDGFCQEGADGMLHAIIPNP